MRLWGFEVAPKPGTRDPAGEAALATLRGFGIGGIESIRSSRLFLVEIDGDRPAAERAARELLGDPISEHVRIFEAGQSLPPTPEATPFEVYYRPGVMDPVAASTASAMAELGLKVGSARTARRFVINPSPAGETSRRIARFLGNDCVEDVAIGGRPLNPPPRPPIKPFELRHIPIRDLDDAALTRLSRDGHLFLSLPEMKAIQAEFRQLGRDPTDIELETLAQTWSEHCVHKTLKSEVVYRGEPIPNQPAGTHHEVSYSNLLKDTIVRATDTLMQAGRGPQCLSVFKDNAGIIAFDHEFAVAFKVETHNHPSAIEPYGGAATGLGGCIRDVIGCGLAAKPIASTDVFCVAPPDWPADALPDGVLHPRQVLRGVVAGVRDYGNRMGIPTVNGAIHFDPRYLANPLVFCGSVGLIPRDRIEKAARPGDAIVVVGGRTGRDGIHGATFSSAELTGGHADEFAHAVQIGNAIEEKKLLDVILAARDYPVAVAAGAPACRGTPARAPSRCLFSAITDCGAGGLSSAIGEMGEKTGADVELANVPLKYAGLRYDEIWISEAQERMVLAVPPENVETFLSLCRSENVEATVIGSFTDTQRLIVRYNGTVVGDLPMRFLHEGLPKQVRLAEWKAVEVPPRPSAPLKTAEQFADELKRLLATPTIASKEWVVRQYDHEVQGRTVIKPLVGVRDDGPGDAAVVLPRLGSSRAIAIGCGLCPQVSDHDPYWMAWFAIDEALRNIVSVGGDPSQTAILDNFCWGRPDDPRQLGGLVRACQACHDAAIAYGLPFISGKDSLNNEFSLSSGDAAMLRSAAARYAIDLPDGATRLSIPGTLLISALSIVPDVAKCVTMDLKQPDAPLYLVGQPTRRRGEAGGRPEFDPAIALETHQLVARLIREGLVASVHDVSDGGLLVAIAEMAIAGNRGCHVHGFDDWIWEDEELDRSPRLVGDEDASESDFYFAEMPALYVVEPRLDRWDAFRHLVRTVPSLLVATTLETDPHHAPIFKFEVPSLKDAFAQLPLEALRSAWKSPPPA